MIAGAGALYAGLRVAWELAKADSPLGEGFIDMSPEDYRAELEETRRWNADHPDPMFQRPVAEPPWTASDWCPGVNPSEDGKAAAGRLQQAGQVTWSLCGDWDAHEPHLRATDPEYVAPEIWCRGVDAVYPSELDDRVRWEQCSATIRHGAHKRWDRRQPDSPELEVTTPGSYWASLHWPKLETTDEDRERLAETGAKLRQAAANALVSVQDTDCGRGWPHPVHIHPDGVCKGRPTAGEEADDGS